jgi:hypothetical protein
MSISNWNMSLLETRHGSFAFCCDTAYSCMVPFCALHTWSWQCHYIHCTHGAGIESRWRRDFAHPFRPALGSTQPPIQCAHGLTPRVKRPGGGDDHPHPSSAQVKERVEVYLYSPCWVFVACSRVNFTFTFISLNGVNLTERCTIPPPPPKKKQNYQPSKNSRLHMW